MNKVSFKEVHADLENENLFLNKSHDIRNFYKKGSFLKDIGFTNSIATKIYLEVSEKNNIIQKYNQIYTHKFILKPQLERVCEKYNLYVRDLDFFLGDIPEKNIQDIMNFKVLLSDTKELSYRHNRVYNRQDEIKNIILKNNNHNPIRFGFHSQENDYLIDINMFREFGLIGDMKIAAVENLFHIDAFKTSKERIINTAELEAKNQVELDPIVLFETKHGYLIITAWGDESNDEIIINNKYN